jgi:hypothetical protein
MTTVKSSIEPLIALRIEGPSNVLHPGDQLVCEYQVDAIQPSEIQAIEASVMWYTEGKGDEDSGIHFFERNTPSDAVDGDLRQLHRLETVLPASPVTYDGAILKIRWCVRVRLFWTPGRQIFQDRAFQLLAAAATNGPRD